MDEAVYYFTQLIVLLFLENYHHGVVPKLNESLTLDASVKSACLEDKNYRAEYLVLCQVAELHQIT